MDRKQERERGNDMQQRATGGTFSNSCDFLLRVMLSVGCSQRGNRMDLAKNATKI